MKTGSIATLFASALLVGWLAPGFRTHDGAAVQSEHAFADDTRQDRLAVNRTDVSTDGPGVLTRHPDGHFYAEGNVDGARLRMLVDTGASMIALTGEDAEALGLSWDEANLKPIGRGANGVVLGVGVRLERIEVEGIEASDVEAAIIPDGLDVSLLGQSFLSKIENVEISGNEMRLGA